ncbi:MAG: DotU family type IV/VI secretion system protein [Holosporales bacterium]|jgi:type IV/VI secretion system ImpK/VasF family protein|nr:DotU family type IV/VI secretion system protein [Holosporales bacterium]
MRGSEGNTFLLTLFDSFCEEVLACRKIAEEEAASSSDKSLEVAERIWKRLNDFLKARTVHYLEQGGDFIDAFLKEALYILAAFADEVFLNLSWSGRSYWEEHLLESAFFGTHIAGEEIFRRMGQFLLGRENSLIEMATLYLKLLAFGFEGQYRAQEHKGKIAVYKQKLHRFIVQEDPSMDFFDACIFRQSYQPTLVDIPKQELPNPSWWHYTFYGFLLSFALATSCIWDVKTASIRHLARTISQIAVMGDHP